MTQAIFLSYASEDADAARRICEALRAAGLEVWFDQSELRGGDAWDTSIRKQIKECALFVPVISANTNAREEGYFRLEWKLAVDRSHLMADDKAFFFPVILEDASEASARVPDAFRARQWTRVTSDDSARAFAERVANVVAGSGAPARSGPKGASNNEIGIQRAAPNSRHSRVRGNDGAEGKPRVSLKWVGVITLVVAIAVTSWFVLRKSTNPNQSPDKAIFTQIQSTHEEARKLAEQARTVLASDFSYGQLERASVLIERAASLDSSSADVLAIAAQVDCERIHNGRWISQVAERARSRILQAQAFAPNAFETRLAKTKADFALAGGTPGPTVEADLRALRAERPNDPRAWVDSFYFLRAMGRPEDAIALMDEMAKNPSLKLHALSFKASGLFRAGQYAEAEALYDQLIAAQPKVFHAFRAAFIKMSWRGDLDGALAVANKIAPQDRQEEQAVALFASLYAMRREPQQVLATLAPVTADWLGIWAPVSALRGNAYEAMGVKDAAMAEWQKALKIVNVQLETEPNDVANLEWKAALLAALGDIAEARRVWKRAAALPPVTMALYYVEKIHRVGTPEDILAELEYRARERYNPLGLEGRARNITAADLRLNPAWDTVRQLPRFKALQAKLDADPRFTPVPTGATR